MASACIALGPARRASRAGGAALGTRGAVGHVATHPILLIGQVALTFVLLVAAGLFIRSLRAGLEADLGFDPEPVSAVSVDLFRYGYDRQRATTFYDEALASASVLPGVEAVALATHVPLAPINLIGVDTADGPYSADAPLESGFVNITSGYFDVMSMPVVTGRAFSSDDGRSGASLAMLNESAARRLFPGRDPIGREVRIFGELTATVVGVVGDAKYSTVRDAALPMIYQNLQHDVPTGGVTVLARSARSEATLPLLRAALQRIDPAVALHDVRRVSAQVDAALAPQRFGSTLLSMFAALALAVAAIGIHGVVAATVSRRTPEIGLRIALGATPGLVVRDVLARTGVAIVVGSVLGFGGAVLVGRALEGLLYGITPIDSVSYAGAAIVLLAAATIAVFRPVRRAALTDPLVALRDE
jgi:predicted permease